MKQDNGKIKIDFFCVYDEWHKSFFNFYDTNFLITGSVKNNSLPVLEHDKKYDIMIISEFRQKVNSYHGTNSNVSTMRLSDVCLSFVAKTISEYCIKNDKKATIALASNRKDKKYKSKNFKKEEIEFFNRDIKNFSLVETDSNLLAAQSDLSICVASNLGFELLSRGKKVLFS